MNGTKHAAASIERFDTAVAMLGAAGVDVSARRTGFLAVEGPGATHVFELRAADPSLGKPALARHPEIAWVFDEVSDALGDELRVAGINYVDLRGNAHLARPGLLVSIRGRTTRWIQFEPLDLTWNVERDEDNPGGERAASVAFGWAGVPVVLALLVRPELCRAPLREIQAVSPASLGTVQRVMQGLKKGRYISTGPRGEILWGRGLLDHFTDAWLTKMSTRLQGARFTAQRSIRDLSPDEQLALEGAISGEAAADLMGLGLRSVTTLLYCDANPPVSAIRGLRLRKDSLGTVEIRRPLWTPELHAGPFAPSPVIRADLLALRDPRTTEIAREMEAKDDQLRRILAT